jgi:hypothetical protein
MALALALAAGLMTTGCAALLVGAAAGVAGAAYVKGDLQTRLQADPRAVEKATAKAFEVLDIHKVSSRGSAVDAEVIGRTATDKKVAVRVKAEDTGESSVSVRVGVFGEEVMSRRIYDELKKHLSDATRVLQEELKGR